MKALTITVLYSCSGCGTADRPVEVRARESEEDVVKWMDQVVTVALANDHHARNSACRPEKLKDVKIPLTGAQWVGGPSVS